MYMYEHYYEFKVEKISFLNFLTLFASFFGSTWDFQGITRYSKKALLTKKLTKSLQQS